MTKPVCIGWRVPGALNTVAAGYNLQCTYVGSIQTRSSEDMGMPLSCPTSTSENYPRQMVLMHAAQVE